MTNYTKKALTNVSIVFAISLVAAFFGYLVRIFFARNLTLEEFGLFYAIIAFLGLFGIFKSFGLDHSLIFFIPKFLAEQDFKSIKNSIFYTSIVLFINNILFILLLLLFANFLGVNYFHHKFAPIILILMAISFFIDSFVLILKLSFQGFQRMLFFSSIDVIRMILILSLSFIFFRLDYGLLSPVMAYIITPLILLFIYGILLYKSNRNIFIKNRFFWQKSLFNRLRKYGSQILLASSFGLIIAYSDRIMITYFRTLEEVGIYSVIFPTAMILWYIPEAIQRVLMPITSELHNKGLKKELKAGIDMVYRYSFIIILPASFLVFYFSDTILNLFYGSNYVSGAMALKVLIIGIIFYSFYKLSSGLFLGLGRPKINTKIALGGATLNIVLNFILIPIYGFLGAAIATSVNFFFMSIIGLYILRKRRFLVVPYFMWVKAIVASALFILIVDYLNWHISLDLFIKIPLTLIFSGLIYLLLIFVFRLITISEIRELLKRLKSV